MTSEILLVLGKDHRLHQMVRPFAEHLLAADDFQEVDALLSCYDPVAVIFDANSQALDNRILQIFQQRHPNLPIIICSDSKKMGVPIHQTHNIYTVNGYEDTSGLAAVLACIQRNTQDINQRFFIRECPPAISIVGKSPAIRQAIQMIRLVAQSACNPILITGETGTGKELAAKAVHLLRHGTEKRFVAVNCAALSASLLESELFGHTKGAFTSADKDKIGLLEYAGDGTIFLDEISEMQPELQAKLLRVLQEKTFRKVGGSEEIECKATIIASTNRNLSKEVQHGRFRQDLYYRLAVCPIHLAPLRCKTRQEDIPLLAEYFIRHSSICPQKKGHIQGLTKMAEQMLLQHSWPGNVRELKNVIERAILLEASDRIGTNNLIFDIENIHLDQANQPTAVALKDFSLEKAERELVKRALEEAGWQKTRAAALLGITRATLYAKVKQYNIQTPNETPETQLIS